MSKYEYVICALYKFVHLPDYQYLQNPLLSLMLKHEIKGTILLAEEGINGTVASDSDGINRLLTWLKSDPRFSDLEHKQSVEDQVPFKRSRVKIKQEVVTMGVDGIDPTTLVGAYVNPKDWNDLISDPDVLLVDTRNDYEVNIGSFEGAVNPNTSSFRDFPQYVINHLDPAKHKKVAMFCTGGIRCEKSTAFLKQQGFEQVFHLQGGILKYLEEIPEEESLWQGECFVFDDRVAVNHSLEKGQYKQCHACRMPITDLDIKSGKYERGVSCPHCYDKVSPERKARFKERQKQVDLASKKGEQHIGSEVRSIAEHRRQSKIKAKLADREASEARSNTDIRQ